jgi:hypothetical protein
MLGELPQATDYYFPLALAFSLNSNEIKRIWSCYSNPNTRLFYSRPVLALFFRDIKTI